MIWSLFADGYAKSLCPDTEVKAYDVAGSPFELTRHSHFA